MPITAIGLISGIVMLQNISPVDKRQSAENAADSWCTKREGQPSAEWRNLSEFELVPIRQNSIPRALNLVKSNTFLPIAYNDAIKLSDMLGSRAKVWRYHIIRLELFTPRERNNDLHKIFQSAEFLVQFSKQIRALQIYSTQLVDIKSTRTHYAAILKSKVAFDKYYCEAIGVS
jgi:hypothetical protein